MDVGEAEGLAHYDLTSSEKTSLSSILNLRMVTATAYRTKSGRRDVQSLNFKKGKL